jgi:hypothetical protein
MGCGASKEDNAGKARNDEIENQLKRDKLAQRNEIKMLLLGKCCIGIKHDPHLTYAQALASLESRLFSSR